MNTPSGARAFILNSLCYNSEKWFTQAKMSKEMGKTKEFIAGELRVMHDLGRVLKWERPGKETKYKKPNPEVAGVARGPWRNRTNEEIGCIAHDCWAVI